MFVIISKVWLGGMTLRPVSFAESGRMGIAAETIAPRLRCVSMTQRLCSVVPLVK